MMPDHYQALGVRPDAGPDEIRAAYLRLMRANHPDYRPGDQRAADRARAANAAWEVLGSSARRAAYDRLRTVRSASKQRHAGRVSRRHADAAITTVAYSSEREAYRQVVTRSLLRFGAGTFVAGLVLLLLLA